MATIEFKDPDPPKPMWQPPEVRKDVFCQQCGYNLRGLKPLGRCPECGQAIRRSLIETGWSWTPAVVTPHLYKGITCLVWSMLVLSASLVGLIFIPYLRITSDYSGNLIVIVFTIGSLAAWGYGLGRGMWYLTPTGLPRASNALRLGQRWMTMLGLASCGLLGIITLPDILPIVFCWGYTIFNWPRIGNLADVLVWISVVGLVGSIVLLPVWLRHLANLRYLPDFPYFWLLLLGGVGCYVVWPIFFVLAWSALCTRILYLAFDNHFVLLLPILSMTIIYLWRLYVLSRRLANYTGAQE
jgi:hypothetical protein